MLMIRNGKKPKGSSTESGTTWVKVSLTNLLNNNTHLNSSISLHFFCYIHVTWLESNRCLYQIAVEALPIELRHELPIPMKSFFVSFIDFCIAIFLETGLSLAGKRSVLHRYIFLYIPSHIHGYFEDRRFEPGPAHLRVS